MNLSKNKTLKAHEKPHTDPTVFMSAQECYICEREKERDTHKNERAGKNSKAI